METIIKVKLLKNNYVIATSKDTYRVDDFFYKCLLPYEGKQLDENQSFELQSFSKAHKTLRNLYKKIYVGAMSKRDLFFKLKEAELEAHEIQVIMNRFKAENYLNEKDYILYHKAIFERNKGAKAFEHFLQLNKIKEERIQEAISNYEENFEFALTYANRLANSKVSSSKMIQQQVYYSLSNKGFTKETIQKVVDSMNDVQEDKNIKKDYEKYKKMYDNPYKLLSKLMQKGYNRDVIKKVMECDCDES